MLSYIEEKIYKKKHFMIIEKTENGFTNPIEMEEYAKYCNICKRLIDFNFNEIEFLNGPYFIYTYIRCPRCGNNIYLGNQYEYQEYKK